MNKHPMSGKLYTQYYVVCGVCNTEMPVAQGHDQAVFYLRRSGWKKTKENGWTCSDCMKPTSLTYDEQHDWWVNEKGQVRFWHGKSTMGGVRR